MARTEEGNRKQKATAQDRAKFMKPHERAMRAEIAAAEERVEQRYAAKRKALEDEIAAAKEKETAPLRAKHDARRKELSLEFTRRRNPDKARKAEIARRLAEARAKIEAQVDRDFQQAALEGDDAADAPEAEVDAPDQPGDQTAAAEE